MKKIGTFEIEEGKVYPSEYYDKSFERAIPCVWTSDEIYCGENHSEAINEFPTPTKLVYPSTGFLINGKVYTRDETDAKFEFGDSSSYLAHGDLDYEAQLEIALTGSEYQKKYLAANENLDPEAQIILAEGSEEIKRVLSENVSLIDELSFLKRGERMLENKPNEREVELAAQTWCKPEVEDRVMDPELAYAFADTLRDYRYEIMKTAEIFDYYEVTVKEAEDIFDRIIDWAEDIDYSDGSDVDNIKDEIIELFKGREIPVEEALDILGGLSELISLKGMEGQDGAMDLVSSWGEGQSAGASSAPTYPESFEAVRGLGGGLDNSGASAPTSGGAMEAGMAPGGGFSQPAQPVGGEGASPSFMGTFEDLSRTLETTYGPGAAPGAEVIPTMVGRQMPGMEEEVFTTPFAAPLEAY